MPEAELEDYVSAFRITFFKRHLSQDERDSKFSANFEVALISELEKRDSMTVAEIMECSGLSRNTVSTKLRELRQRGVIESTERPKSPKQRYRLVEKMPCFPKDKKRLRHTSKSIPDLNTK